MLIIGLGQLGLPVVKEQWVQIYLFPRSLNYHKNSDSRFQIN